MRSQEFLVAVHYRLGIPVFQADGPCPACNHPSDIYGDHALSCASNGERISRHNWLRDAIFDTAYRARLSPAHEVRVLPGRAARPADVYIPVWHRGMDAALDVTVVSPLAAYNLNGCLRDRDHALDKAQNSKWRLVGEDCRRESIAFIPLPVETFGAWHHNALDNLSRLARDLARKTSSIESIAINHFFQRLSVLLQRGNATLILSRQPSFPPASVSGDQ